MLGNSRFLIIVISVLTAVALICLGASAVGVDKVVSPDIVKSPPASVVAPSFAFTTSYESRTTGAPNSNTLLDDLGSATYSVYYVYLHGTDHTGSFTYPVVEVSGQSSFDFRLYAVDTTVYAEIDGEVYTVGYKGTYIDFVCGSFEPLSFAHSTLLTSRTVPATFDMNSLFNSLLSVGNKLVSFVMSSWIVLVPVVAFVCVLGYGVIRRLVKGV